MGKYEHHVYVYDLSDGYLLFAQWRVFTRDPSGGVAKSISRGLRIARTEDGIFASSARMPATAVITNHFHGTLPQRRRNGVEGTAKGQRATIETQRD